jgi:3-oxoacyl-[acyl-carrier-protein] synthase II
MMPRVAITGIGAVTSLGVGRAVLWKSLLGGCSGIGPVTSFDTANYPVNRGGEIAYWPVRQGRAASFAVAAARLALQDAELDLDHFDPRRASVLLGTTSGEPGLIESLDDAACAQRADFSPSEFLRQYPAHVLAAAVSRDLGFTGPSVTFPTACAAGNYAIGYGFDLLRAGRADAVLAGGADAFSRITYTGFARLGAIAPERCQPFDRNRKGMIPSEGAAVVLLEPLDRACRRGAHVFAEITGYGISCDAHHMTAGHPQADGAVRALTEALASSRTRADDISYISAHGTGTPVSDRLETLTIKRALGDAARHIPISSVKSMLGHAMGAASAIEAAVCALAIDTGSIPPTINLECPDPDCDLDYVPNVARSIDVRVAVNNAYAFGGTNTTLVLQKV